MDTALRIWEGCGWRGLVGFQSLQNKSLVEVGSFNEIKMHDHLRDRVAVLSWGPTKNIDEVLQKSDVSAHVIETYFYSLLKRNLC